MCVTGVVDPSPNLFVCLFVCLELDMAIAYWNIVMKERFKFLDLWCTFLKVHNGALYNQSLHPTERFVTRLHWDTTQ